MLKLSGGLQIFLLRRVSATRMGEYLRLFVNVHTLNADIF